MAPTIYLDQIVEILRAWYDKRGIGEHFSEIYVFGSLINRDGRHFVATGAEHSDVDVLLKFRQKDADFERRMNGLRLLRETISEVEYETLVALERADMAGHVYSFLPVTHYEVFYCIHKGFDPKIFTSNIFYDVVKEEIADPLASYVDFDFHYENIETFSFIRLCQKIRNLYVKVSADKKPAFEQHDGSDVLSKEVLRAAALLNYSSDGSASFELRTDLEEGYNFTRRFVESRRGSNQQIAELWDRISARGFGRSENEPLPADSVMLCMELLYDECRRLITPSIREVLDTMIGRDQ